MKDFFVRIISFLFRACFLFWLLLAGLELLMPGFVIYHFSLNWFLLAVLLFGVGSALFSGCEITKGCEKSRNYERLRKIAKSRKYEILLGAMAVVFFFAYSFFALNVYLPVANNAMIFDWPDETANYFFIKNFQTTNSFVAAEPLNELLANPYVHPRSVNIVGSAIVPMSFPGMMIIYGAAAKIVGAYGILFLTPLFGVLTVVLLSLLMRKFFGETVGFFAAFFCFIVPGFWYYSSMVMLPNVLFLFLLSGGVFMVTKDYEKSKNRYEILFGTSIAGALVGLALITRLTEIIWIVLFFAILAAANWRAIKKNWRAALVFCAGVFLPILLMLIFNHQVYGKWLTLGYLRQNQPAFLSGLPTEFQVVGDSVLKSFKLIFLPFGFNGRFSLSIFWEYIVRLQWPFFAAALGAVIWLLFVKKNKNEKVFLATGAAVSGWVAFFYGNWVLADSLVLQYNRLSSSYARYFLPIYLFGALAIAWASGKIGALKLNRLIKISIVAALSVVLLLFSVSAVFLNEQDGLFAQAKKIENYHAQRTTVESLIPDGALLIVDRADKIFWPKYKVVVFQGDFGIFQEMKKLLPIVPIYYFGQIDDENIAKINAENLKILKLKFVERGVIDDNFSLYQLIVK